MHTDDDYSNDRSQHTDCVIMAYKSRAVSQLCDTEAEQMLGVSPESLVSSSYRAIFCMMSLNSDNFNVFCFK